MTDALYFSGLLLAPVVFLQVVYLAKSTNLTTQDVESKLEEWCKDYREDIFERAVRGRFPNWTRYFDEFDRSAEATIEGLRQFAMAALTTGVGGTLLAMLGECFVAFIMDVTSDMRIEDLSLNNLILMLGLPLLSSFIGVLNHLYILRCAHQTECGFVELRSRFLHTLQEASNKHRPVFPFEGAIRAELGKAFREAVQKFPEAFARLDENVADLGGIIERQGQAMVSMTSSLESSTRELSKASAQLKPTMSTLARTTEELHNVATEIGDVMNTALMRWQEQVGDVMNTALMRWQEQVRNDQDAFVDVVRDILDKTAAVFQRWERERSEAWELEQKVRLKMDEVLHKALLELSKSIDSLPTTFGDGITRFTDELGAKFGFHVLNGVRDLQNTIKAGHTSLVDTCEKSIITLRNTIQENMADLVAKTVEEIYGRVDQTLICRLEGIGRELTSVLVDLPASAQDFAESLVEARKGLQEAVNRIKITVDLLSEAASVPAEFQQQLTSEVEQSVEVAFEPVLSELSDVVKRVGGKVEDQGQRDGLHLRKRLQWLVSVTRDLIRTVTERLRGARFR